VAAPAVAAPAVAVPAVAVPAAGAAPAAGQVLIRPERVFQARPNAVATASAQTLAISPGSTPV
jgi:hypothetical protein